MYGFRTLCRSCKSKIKLLRYYGTKPKRYSDTLNLPQTKFPLSMKDGLAGKREERVQKTAAFASLYKWQEKQDRKSTFILHDGPPYANGDPHVGHALNKILKDVTNRYKLLRGHRVHYVPGWDCHGTPIEQKALAEIKAHHKELEPMAIRKRAKQFAQRAIKKQMKAFKRWGVMADWNNCYYSYNPEFEASQLQVFYWMYEKGFAYEDYMPVYWSPSSGTALAEAELEYNDQHISKSVYVKFPVKELPEDLRSAVGNLQAYAVIWTTTPWTLPANKAICYGNNIMYAFVRPQKAQEVYLVCGDFVKKFEELLDAELQVLCTFPGSALKGCHYVHPLAVSENKPLLAASHVTVAKGTGLVHTAPAHGQEDFQVAINHGLSMDCMVDEDGCYTHQAGPELENKPVMDEGNETVLRLMESSIVHQEDFVHSYPYDWRTKQPVILRASKQWFINTSAIKDKALDCLSDVTIRPRGSSQGMLSQLALRTYWCISRQRVWGVPIPVFYQKDTGQLLLTKASVNHIQQLIKQHGSDCWWTLPQDELLPKEVIKQSGLDPDAEYVKGTDIFDIWFDSGSTWAQVLKDYNGQADLYLEGLDQFGGWFQSSLLTSVAVNDKAPYRSLLVHGFAMDEEGRKMSKSLGNVVDPESVIHGTKDQPGHGADVLRWWAARAHLDSKVHIGPQVLEQCKEQVFKVRKSLRYLLGNLYDFDYTRNHIKPTDMLPQDQYMLHLLAQFISQVTSSYEEFNYARVLILTEKFINSHVSSFYCHITKDRLYCEVPDSIARRSAQTVIHHLLHNLTVILAPIIPHLTEEVFSFITHKDVDSVFKTSWCKQMDQWTAPDLEEIFDLTFILKDAFYGTIGTENPLEFDLVFSLQDHAFKRIKVLQTDMTSSSSPLVEVLQAASVTVLSRPPLVIPDDSEPVEGRFNIKLQDGSVKEEHYLMLLLPSMAYICERCRRYTSEAYGKPCGRCLDVMAQGWAD